MSTNSQIQQIFDKYRPAVSPELDPSTLSNYHQFKVTKTALDLKVSFAAETVSGDVTFNLTTVGAIDQIVLDSSYLAITSVIVNGKPAQFSVEDRVEPLGAAVKIACIAGSGAELAVKISFSTTDKCTALQFLSKEATDGKKEPYLFSQCQAIHARSLFPCFDTPAFKSPYSMKVESPYLTLMSGRPVAAESHDNVYVFDQPIPIPSYLVAIASGDITSLPIGPRSNVYCEPCNIDKCQYEFEQDMENFLVAAEKLIFEYEWKNYDALILPASFPYGGMENPNITFATPTLVSGDRENVDVLAHELAHSWSGNLVTNCSWEHFWLNEGWTVYIERRILGSIHGEAHRHFSAIIGWTDLDNSIKSMGESAARFSTLVQDLKDGTDPDDSFSTVPYEKGSNLIYHIETVLGGKEVFDPFIPHYFTKFRYSSLDTYQFLDTLYEFFSDKTELLDSIDWNTWLYKPGMPPKPKFDTTLVDKCYALADKWINLVSRGAPAEEFRASFNASDIADFSANMSVVFLDNLSGSKLVDWKSPSGKLAAELMSDLYPSYGASANAEVVFRWFRLQLTAENKSDYQPLADWLGTVGRMKFVRPGYMLLNKADHELAVETFRRFENGYHPICKGMVRKDLGV